MIRTASPLTNQISWDVIVIGAGPAGTSAAIESARRGLSVLVLDSKKFPRPKVCGGCLNQVSISLLKSLIGNEHPFWEAGTPLNSFALHYRKSSITVETPTGLAVDRSRLDQCLVDVAMEYGVCFRDGVNARLGDVVDNWRLVHTSRSGTTETLRAGVVVVASGLNDRCVNDFNDLRHRASPNSRVGIETIVPWDDSKDYPAGSAKNTIQMAVGRHGYVGITELAGGRFHLAASVDRPQLQKLGPPDTVSQILREAGFANVNRFDGQWRGTPSLTSRPTRMAAERVFLVGDAAGYVEPFTGEGIRWALQSGIGVATWVESGVAHWDSKWIEQWESWHGKNVGHSQRLCRTISTLLKSSLARFAAHQLLKLRPGLANLVVDRLNRNCSRARLIRS